MKRLIYIICVLTLCFISCNKKETVIPDLSGKYTCSFSIPASPEYIANGMLNIQKTGDSSYKVSGNVPFQNAKLLCFSESQYQFNIPQTEIERNGKTYYVTLFATLKYGNGVFNTSYCQAAYGEKGVSGRTYNVSDFKLNKK